LEVAATRRLTSRDSVWLGGAALAALAAALLLARPAHAAVHHAALVIQHSSGRVLSRCIAFAEEQLTGLELIQRSGIQVQTQSFGTIGSAVCQLDREPAQAPADCFGSGAYWQYSRRRGTGWQPSDLGASRSVVRDGDMDGWRYAAGSGQAPPALAFSAVCAAPAPVAVGHSASPLPSRVQPSRAAAATEPAAPAIASPPASTPAAQALAPSTSPSPPLTLASKGPPPRSPPPDLRLFLFGIGLALLAGLAAWNLVLRR
jgi:hypothetical protein